VSAIVWTKFYWSDWESDPALRLCSLAAQGFWMRMLCIASAHDPIGYVAVAGRGLDETALARMTGCSGSEVTDLLGELDRNGVFSRDRQGRIFSRRMVKDARRAAIARKNGKKGGNPTLGKHEGNNEGDNPPVKAGVKTQEPEARSQKETSPDGIDAGPSPDLDKRAWDEAVISLHRGGLSEQKARAFFGKLLKDNRLTARDLLPSLLNAQINGTQDPQGYLTKAAAAVARQRGTTVPAAVPITQWDDSRWSAVLALNREEGWWQDDLGPRPGEPGCRVPQHIIEQRAAA
jgi:hypothetical protein